MSSSGWVDLKPPTLPPAVVLVCVGCGSSIGTYQAPAGWIDPETFFCVECIHAGALLGCRRDPASLRPLEEVLDELAVLRGVPQTRTDVADVLATVEPAVPGAVSVGGSSGGGPLSTETEVDPHLALLRETSVEEAGVQTADDADVSPSTDEDEPEPPIAWGTDDLAARDIARNRAAVENGTYDPATAEVPF